MAKENIADIQEELESRFLTYALSTIVSRSLPDVRDGLKPIHRRILYAMNAMGVNEAAKFVKSAKIIGEVLGKYHPHGDASTYESMVRMAQDFSLRYPLVDGKGNFGSLDGDPPAAYRYTEGRLHSISTYLLQDLKKETVDFKQNYDNTLKEPVVLPSKIPNLLINGASGIAVGMACSFPSHNLREVNNALVDLIDNPDNTVAQLMKHIKGPDFPTGAIILNSKTEIRKAYQDGSGAVKMRGEWKREDLPRGKQQIIITSIPYGVNKAKMIEKIAEIIIAKKLPPLIDIRDESDEKIRIVLEMKANSNADKIMSYIFKHSDMESNFQLNFTCLKPNGEPGRLSLLEICRYFLDFRKEVIIRRLKYELALIEKRLHILAAFAIIFDNLDKALKLIRSSTSRKEAHEKLANAFDLDDEQTSAILEIPLYRLVSMEIDKIIAEQQEKLKEKKRIEGILKSDKKIWGVVKEELQEISEKFGDKRKTTIKQIESVEYNAEDFIQHEDVSLVISKNGWLRKLKTLNDPGTLKFKENDELLGTLKSNTKELAAFFTSQGMVYVQKIHNFPHTRSGFGEPIQNLFKFADGEQVLKMMSLNPQDLLAGIAPKAGKKSSKAKTKTAQASLDFSADEADSDAIMEKLEFMVMSEAGYGLRFPASNLTETTKAGRKIMNLKGDDRMVGISLVQADHVFMATADGKGLRIATDQVSKLTGSGMGVKLIKIQDSPVVGFKFVNKKDKITLAFESGKTKEILANKVPVYNRGSQGVIIARRNKIIHIV
ncbi:MAG: DNA topoisomerase (ATP-hydrolyzing) [Nitrospinaceae bacterium]|nr:MAG: DNA topoisomerase (ATP-hydrolyzing) [Nitrospinaceae bacterium]